MKSHRLLFSAVLISALFCLGLMPQAAHAASSKSMDRADKTFVKDAAIGGMKEVELGKIAARNAQSPEVKQFGNLMAENHSAANDQLIKLAQQKGITLPERLDRKDQSAIDRLSKLNGPEFDREYMSEMVKDHEKALSQFQKETSKGKDKDLVAFANQILPTIELHLDHAKTINGTMRK